MGHRLMRLAHSFYFSILDFIYPPHCLICQTSLEPETRFVCKTCWSEFKVLPQPLLPVSQLDILHDQAAHFVQSLAIYFYSDQIQYLIHTMKYKNMPGICVLFGNALGHLIREHHFLRDIDLILPVPLHPIRYRERGFNQAELLARQIGGLNNVPVDGKVLKRLRYTDQQAKFSKQERARNVCGAFGIAHQSVVENKHIAVVDDVLTTGSTMNECAKILKQSGAKHITTITIVRI